MGGDGSAGTGPGEFTKPLAIAVASDGTVHVSDGAPLDPGDGTPSRIQHFTADGAFLDSFVPGGQALRLAVDRQSNVYATVAEATRRLLKFSPAHRLIAQLAAGSSTPSPSVLFGPNAPLGIAVDQRVSAIWATDPGHVRMRKLSSTGRLLATCGPIPGLPADEIAVGRSGDVFVASQVRIGVITAVRRPAEPCDRERPTLRSLRLVPSPLRTHDAAGRLDYRLSEPAIVTVLIERKLVRAHRPTYTLVGRLRLSSTRGLNRKQFPPRLRGRRLPVGEYRAKLTAADDSGNRSTEHRLGFLIRTR
jgi:hypothetical protein